MLHAIRLGELELGFGPTQTNLGDEDRAFHALGMDRRVLVFLIGGAVDLGGDFELLPGLHFSEEHFGITDNEGVLAGLKLEGTDLSYAGHRDRVTLVGPRRFTHDEECS